MKLASLILMMLFFFQQQSNKDQFFIGSWNVENLFDTVDDLNKSDEDFTPNGRKNWTNERLSKKIKNLATVINKMNDGYGPDILGLMEVEHKYLVDSLCKAYLKNKNYRVVGFESPDKRGIDNYLFFDAAKFELKNYDKITVQFFGEEYVTRDILHVALVFKNEILDIFVNHWPSRRGGEESSQPRRINAASTLMQYIDSLKTCRKKDNFIIMGDFNDEPHNYSISNILSAAELSRESFLYNLSLEKSNENLGTHYYNEEFNMLDQIIISKDLIDKTGIEYKPGSFSIFRDETFIYTTGKKNKAIIPTFGEGKYIGGYSDHLPVTALFYYKEEN